MRARTLIGGTALAAVLAAGGWVAWARLTSPPLLGEDPAADAAVSPALAEATLDRVEGLRAGSGGSLSLGGAELSSVMRYALPGLLPPGVSEPAVRIDDGRVELGARVATAAFPDLPALGDVVGILPDTVDVRIQGSLGSFGKESLAYRVSSIEASGIPLPDRLIPNVLEAFGRQQRRGLPRNALHIPMPGGLDSIYVAADSLVLVAAR